MLNISPRPLISCNGKILVNLAPCFLSHCHFLCYIITPCVFCMSPVCTPTPIPPYLYGLSDWQGHDKTPYHILFMLSLAHNISKRTPSNVIHCFTVKIRSLFDVCSPAKIRWTLVSAFSIVHFESALANSHVLARPIPGCRSYEFYSTTMFLAVLWPLVLATVRFTVFCSDGALTTALHSSLPCIYSSFHQCEILIRTIVHLILLDLVLLTVRRRAQIFSIFIM
jgi:hypothetical protein